MKHYLALFLLVVTLSIERTTYHITYSGHADEVHLIIQNDDQTPPYYEVEAFTIGADVEALDILRHKLPKGSYVVQVETVVWNEAGTELVLNERSKPIIIHIAKD